MEDRGGPDPSVQTLGSSETPNETPSRRRAVCTVSLMEEKEAAQVELEAEAKAKRAKVEDAEPERPPSHVRRRRRGSIFSREAS